MTTTELTVEPSLIWDDLVAYLDDQQQFADEVSRVWARQIESSRGQMESAVSDLTERFGGIVSRLDMMLSRSDDSAGGGINAKATAVRDSSEQRLLGLVDSLRASMDSKAQMLAKVQGLDGFLTDLGQMAQAISRIAQQTHLLSINAAIEAAHAGKSGTGFSVVALEVRELSKLSGDTGNNITNTVKTIQAAIRSTQVAAAESARQDEQARLDSEQTIQAVLNDFAGLTTTLKNSADDMREESRGIKQEIDEAMVYLQFQDRVGQVMSHVSQNIEQFARYQQENATLCLSEGALIALDPRGLLAELEATYAMAEEHDTHQGADAKTAAAAPEITFF